MSVDAIRQNLDALETLMRQDPVAIDTAHKHLRLIRFAADSVADELGSINRRQRDSDVQIAARIANERRKAEAEAERLRLAALVPDHSGIDYVSGYRTEGTPNG